MTYEQTAIGLQAVVPGAERISDRERAERAMQAPKRGGDRPMDERGLWGDPASRADLFDSLGNTANGG